MPRYVDFTPDRKLQLADGSVSIATGQDAFIDTTVAGSVPVFDVGTAAANLRVVVDVTTCTLNADSIYYLHVYGSNDSTMQTGVYLLGSIVLGHSGLLGTGVHRGVGRHSMTCTNVASNSPATFAAQTLTPMRYVCARLWANGLSGTITFQAWIASAK
jgi:hypothetical protein